MDVIQASGLAKPVFFPEFLDYASAGFCSGQGGGSFGDLGEVSVFETFGDGCEDSVNGCLNLVGLGFDFEFYVTDFHLYAYWWVLRFFCQLFTYCILYCTRCTCTILKYFTNKDIEYW
jgi:hypothetical protein